MPARRFAVTLLACALVPLEAACGSGAPAKPAATQTAAPLRAATPTPDPALAPLPPAGRGGPAGARAVAFRAGDGTGLRGRLFGKRADGAVVLVHMGNGASSEADWFGLARRLAREGYLVLAYNRRGVCSGDKAYDCSTGPDDWAKTWQDVTGAVNFVRARGARRYAVIGSSIGASSALYATRTGAIEPAALVSLAGVNYQAAFSFSRADLRAISVPKLFVSARTDPDQAERSAKEWYGWARAPKRIALIESDRHGTDMLAPAQPSHVPLTTLLVRFLRSTLPPG